MIALGIGAGFMSIMKRTLKILVISLIIVIIILASVESPLLPRFKKITVLDQGRRDMWASTWEQFKQHPVIGVGYGKVGGLYRTGTGGALRGILSESTNQMVVVDNSYLLLLAETGIIGLGLFCLLLIFIFKRGWSLNKELRSPYLRQLSICLLTILTVISLGAVNFNIFGMVFPINFYFWLLAGIMVNLKNIDGDVSEQEEEF